MSDIDRPSERHMTVGELADRIGIPVDTILRFHADGRIVGRPMPGTLGAVQFRLSEVEGAWTASSGRGDQHSRRQP